MGSGGGGGGQSRAAAREREHQARLGRLQSDIYETNIGLMSDSISTNLQLFDDSAGQALGSTALQLARTGGLSRRSSALSSSEKLGVPKISDPLESLRSELSDVQGSLALFDKRNEISSQISQLGTRTEATYTYNDGQTTGTYTGPTPSPGDEPEGYSPGGVEFTAEELERKKELESQLADINTKINGLDESERDLTEKADVLSEQVKTLEEVVGDLQKAAPEDIQRQQSFNYTAGSTHTAASKALQNVLFQRDKMFQDGVGSLLQMTQAMISAESQAEANAAAADDYMDLADVQDFNQTLGIIMQGAGLAAGVGLSVATMGAATPVTLGTGLALGGATGSFLGNAFAR